MKSLSVRQKAAAAVFVLLLLSNKCKTKRFGLNNFAICQMNEFINTNHGELTRNFIGVTNICFITLMNYINSSLGVLQSEQSKYLPLKLRIFIGLQWLTKGSSIRVQSATFHLSNESIMKCRYSTISIMMKLYPLLVKWSLFDEQYRIKISSKDNMRQFSNCIGAIDGTHIEILPPASTKKAFSNRHSFYSTNILLICNFDMLFLYALAGCEGFYFIVLLFKFLKFYF